MTNSSAEPIGVAVIGSGIIARRFLVVFDEAPETEVSVLCCRNEEKGLTLATARGVEFTSDVTQAVSRQDVDLVYVALPPSKHLEVVKLALASGKHVLCESPLSLSSQECSDLVEAAKSNSHLVTAVNFPLHYLDGAVQFKKLLNTGFCGNVKHIDIRLRFPTWPRPWQPASWLSNRDHGGPLREVGMHYLVMLQELFPGINLDKVGGTVQYPGKDGCEDFVVAQLSLENNIVCSFNLLTGVCVAEECQLTVEGTKGSLCFEDWYKLKGTHNSASEMKTLVSSRNPILRQLISEMARAIQGPLEERKKADVVSFEQVLRAHHWLDKIRQSQP